MYSRIYALKKLDWIPDHDSIGCYINPYDMN